jgi:hypothetical protein
VFFGCTVLFQAAVSGSKKINEFTVNCARTESKYSLRCGWEKSGLMNTVVRIPAEVKYYWILSKYP